MAKSKRQNDSINSVSMYQRKMVTNTLTLSWRRFLSYGNQLCKSMDWSLYNKDLSHERVNANTYCSKMVRQTFTAQKMKFSIKDFFRKCAQIRSFLRIWSHLLKKSVIENFAFCAVFAIFYVKGLRQCWNSRISKYLKDFQSIQIFWKKSILWRKISQSPKAISYQLQHISEAATTCVF